MKATTEYARIKLGTRFISHEQISYLYNMLYSSEESEENVLEKTFPSKEIIDYLCSEHFLLVAGPSEPICCYAIIGLMGQSGNKFRFESESFFWYEKLNPKWIAIKNCPSNESYNVGSLKKQQDQLKKQGRILPTLTEVLWSFNLIAERNKVMPLKPFRTSTLGMFERNVVVYTKNDEIIISSGFDEEREDLCLLEAISLSSFKS